MGLIEKLIGLGIKYLAVDAYYFKQKFVSPVVGAGLHMLAS